MRLALLLAGLSAFGLAGCGPGVKSPTKGLVTSNKGPITLGTGDMKAPRQGTATSYYIWIPFIVDFAWGDSSVETASKNGAISSVASADSDNLFILLFGRRTTVVYGS